MIKGEYNEKESKNDREFSECKRERERKQNKETWGGGGGGGRNGREKDLPAYTPIAVST